MNNISNTRKFIFITIFSLSIIFLLKISSPKKKDILNLEISKIQYRKVVEHSIKNRSYKLLAHHAFYSNNMITQKEFEEIENIYNRITSMDSIELLLQEKAYETPDEKPIITSDEE